MAEIEGIDFARLDLSEFTEDLMDGSREPSVSLPEADDTGADHAHAHPRLLPAGAMTMRTVLRAP